MPRKLFTHLSLALEDIADGKIRDEEELVYYCKITDFKQLEKAASKEFQEQWEIKVPRSDSNTGSGCVRVRCTGEENKEYTLTAKVHTKQADKRLENTIESTEDMFNLFAVLASSGMRKMRYNFPVEGTKLVFEVDIYFKDDGSMAEYCKVDLELVEKVSKIPELPLKFDSVLLQGVDNTDTEKAFIRGLYDTVFLTKKRLAVKPEGLPA